LKTRRQRRVFFMTASGVSRWFADRLGLASVRRRGMTPSVERGETRA
jgi:hypothetical protein